MARVCLHALPQRYRRLRRYRDRGKLVSGKNIHWAVALNRRNRTLSFALSFVVVGTHLHVVGASLLQWSLLALQLLVYPQLVYRVALRSADPLRAEIRNMLLDGVLLGAWCAFWGMPLWLCFLFFICVSLNLMIFEGLPGLARALAAICLGIAAVALLAGFRFRPDTTLATSLLCIAMLATYLLTFAYGAYRRGLALRESSAQLHARIEEITTLQTRLQEQASRDPLTGLFNRRHFDRALAEALAHCLREDKPLTLAITDIDHFKAINDNHGHLAGDEVLRSLADLLAGKVGDAGMVCRFGGEEFLLMLPGMPAAEACAFADALRREFESMRVRLDGHAIGTTLSFGVAVAPDDAIDAHALLRKADAALYTAKLRGRNRVAMFSPVGLADATVS